MSLSVLVPLATVALGGMITVSLIEDRAKSRGSTSKAYRVLAISLTLLFLGFFIAAHIAADRLRSKGTDSGWGLWLWVFPFILAGFNWLRSRNEPESERPQNKWLGSPAIYVLMVVALTIVFMILLKD